MTIETALATIRAKVGEESDLDAKLKFDCGADGAILIDGTVAPNAVSVSDGPADCTIALSLADLEAILAGDIEPMAAFTEGKIRVDGDLSVALRLSSVF